MALPDRRDCSLFVYGSLELPEVMRTVTGRAFRARPARLSCHRRRVIHGEVYPGIVPDEAESVDGMLYRGLDADALCVLDVFEGDPYRRITVTVSCVDRGALDAYTYVLHDRHAGLLTDRRWDREHFRAHHLEDFLATCRRFRASLAAGAPDARSIG